MTRSELAHRIYQTSHLTGQFTLRSGAIATEYFDKYQFETRPELLCELARASPAFDSRRYRCSRRS